MRFGSAISLGFLTAVLYGCDQTEEVDTSATDYPLIDQIEATTASQTKSLEMIDESTSETIERLASVSQTFHEVEQRLETWTAENIELDQLVTELENNFNINPTTQSITPSVTSTFQEGESSTYNSARSARIRELAELIISTMEGEGIISYKTGITNSPVIINNDISFSEGQYYSVELVAAQTKYVILLSDAPPNGKDMLMVGKKIAAYESPDEKIQNLPAELRQWHDMGLSGNCDYGKIQSSVGNTVFMDWNGNKIGLGNRDSFQNEMRRDVDILMEFYTNLNSE